MVKPNRSFGAGNFITQIHPATKRPADFELTDRIRIEYTASARLAGAIERHQGFIRSETLALEMVPVSAPAGESVETFSIGQETISIGITRVVQ